MSCCYFRAGGLDRIFCVDEFEGSVFYVTDALESLFVSYSESGVLRRYWVEKCSVETFGSCVPSEIRVASRCALYYIKREVEVWGRKKESNYY